MTLDVSPADARRIFAARELGRLTAVLRTPTDEDDIQMLKEDAQSILGLVPPSQKRLSVQVIYADRLKAWP
jgi:pilus assembly protein CpaB